MHKDYSFIVWFAAVGFVGGLLTGAVTALPMRPTLDYTYRHNMAVAKQVVHFKGSYVVQEEDAIALGTEWYFNAINHW